MIIVVIFNDCYVKYDDGPNVYGLGNNHSHIFLYGRLWFYVPAGQKNYRIYINFLIENNIR